jgi:hypothetical protein
MENQAMTDTNKINTKLDELAKEAIYVREENLIAALRIAVEGLHKIANGILPDGDHASVPTIMFAEEIVRAISEALEGKP